MKASTQSILILVLVFVFSGLHNIELNGQLNYLDTTFNITGKVITSLDSSYSFVASSKLQTDGKIVVTGFVQDSNYYDHVLLTRYNPNGSIDTSFNGGVPIITEFQSNNDCYGNAIGVTSDNKIVIAGWTCPSAGNANFLIMRFNDDGTLDPTFDLDGMVSTDLGPGDDMTLGLCIQPNDKIIIAGSTEVGGPDLDQFAILRYNIDGSLDTSFNGTGYRIINLTLDPEQITAIELQTDSKILIAGRTHHCTDHTLILMRLLIDGSTDSTFNSIGYNIISFGTPSNQIYDMAIQPDGKIVAVGARYYTGGGNVFDVAVMRFNLNGVLDSSFNGNGILIFDTQSGYGADIGTGVAIMSDGKIVTGGTNYNGMNHDFVLSRINSNGTLDNTFGNNGIFITDFGGGYDFSYSLCIQPDDRVILVGHSGDNLFDDIALARYFPSGYIGHETTGINQPLSNNISVYPNPVISSATIAYNLSQNEIINIKLYDLRGNLVEIYSDGLEQSIGNHAQSIFIPENLAHGIYSLVFQTKNRCSVIKLVK